MGNMVTQWFLSYSPHDRLGYWQSHWEAKGEWAEAAGEYSVGWRWVEDRATWAAGTSPLHISVHGHGAMHSAHTLIGYLHHSRMKYNI